MQIEQRLVLFIAVLGTCLASPLDLIDTQQDLNPELIKQSKMEHKRLARNVIIDTAKRWPNNAVCYRFNSAFKSSQTDYVLDAMAYIVNCTNIQFVEDTVGRVDCVSINPVPAGSGCNSNVGYLGVPQTLTLPNIAVGTGCFTKFQIVHELLHTCGMYHQHAAHDRQNYVDIMWANIIPGQENAFVQKPPSEATSFGYSYDYDSVMHYGRKTDSSNGQDTIVPKTSVAIGQRTQMSNTDVLKMLKMYPKITKLTHG